MPDKKDQLSVERQAIIVIHGIGEQRPMDTLRDFVQSIAPPVPPAKDADPSKPPKRKFFNKPDVLSDTFELRRLTASKHAKTFKTDYFEYYWAYKMSGTKLSDIVWWTKEILWRPKKNIPERIRWVYTFFWTGILLALLIGFLVLLNKMFGLQPYAHQLMKSMNIRYNTDKKTRIGLYNQTGNRIGVLSEAVEKDWRVSSILAIVFKWIVPGI